MKTKERFQWLGETQELVKDIAEHKWSFKFETNMYYQYPLLLM